MFQDLIKSTDSPKAQRSDRLTWEPKEFFSASLLEEQGMEA